MPPAIGLFFRLGLVTSLLSAPATPLAAQEIQLESDTDVASAGYFQLRWSAESAIELVEARTADFHQARMIYSGSDGARVMSGKPDGDWYYRASAQASKDSVSNTVKVTVRHHPVGRAFAYFAVGSVVFVATLLTILGGSRKTGNTRTMQ